MNKLYKLGFDKQSIVVRDIKGSSDVKFVYQKLLRNDYNFNRIPFKKNDIVIDIGAHVGIVSLYLFKKYGIKSFAFEPLSFNYNNMISNIIRNSANTYKVIPSKYALTSHEQDIELICNLADDTGGVTSNLINMDLPEHYKEVVNSITLDQIFDIYNIKKCKLLKIDCEGSEYEILFNTKILDKVEYICIEIHENELLKSRGYTLHKLLHFLMKYVNRSKIFYTYVKMTE
jgi:FkbM family methyltransferase